MSRSRNPPPSHDDEPASPISAVARLASDALRLALRPATEAVAITGHLERGARAAAGQLAGNAALAVVDAVVASPYAERAVDHVLDSPLAEHAVGRALSGRLVDVTARDIADLADRGLRDGTARHVAEQILERPELGQIVALVLDSPGTEQLVTRIVESPAMERTVEQLIESQLFDQLVVKLLESKELWILVDEIAQSPAVTEAITQQSLGFADEIADEVNVRTRRADATAERVARRLLRRRARVEPPPPSPEGAP